MRSVGRVQDSGGIRRLQGFTLAVCLGLCVVQTSGQGSDVAAAVGATVTLSAPDTTVKFVACIWYRGSSENPTQRILAYVPGGSLPQSNGPQYSGRETGLSTGALEIRDVRTTDTGSYFVSMVLKDGSRSTAITQLTVYEYDSSQCWPIRLGSSLTVLIVGACVVIGVVLFIEWWEKTLKGKTTDQNHLMQHVGDQYENVTRGPQNIPTVQTVDEDATYMRLTHENQAMYDQLKR